MLDAIWNFLTVNLGTKIISVVIAVVLWVVVLGSVTVVEMMLLRWGKRLFAAPLPALGVPLTERWVEPLTLSGAAMTAYGLAFVAANGFAPDGQFPLVAAVAFVVGALLVAVRPTEFARQKAGTVPTTGG